MVVEVGNWIPKTPLKSSVYLLLHAHFFMSTPSSLHLSILRSIYPFSPNEFLTFFLRFTSCLLRPDYDLYWLFLYSLPSYCFPWHWTHHCRTQWAIQNFLIGSSIFCQDQHHLRDHPYFCWKIYISRSPNVNKDVPHSLFYINPPVIF